MAALSERYTKILGLDAEASLSRWKLGFVHGARGDVAELGGERLESQSFL